MAGVKIAYSGTLIAEMDAQGTKTLHTSGKYCKGNIQVAYDPPSGGAELPELENPGTAGDLMEGKQLLDGAGAKVTGTFTIAQELAEQTALIEQISTVLAGKVAGGAGDPELPPGWWRCDYIQFDGKQTVDTGRKCTQNTRLRIDYTRERATQHYLFGHASEGNNASFTAYQGGSWRYGNKSVTKTVVTRADMVYSAIMSSSEITITGSAQTITGVNDFETISTLTIGSCRNTDGSLGAPQYEGKVEMVQMWEEGELVLDLTPVTDGTAYAFWDTVSKKFYESITDTPLAGGNW